MPQDRQKAKKIQLGLQEPLIVSEEAVLDYHNRCIPHLRLLANEPDAIMDENLLAAAVVLRSYEELDGEFYRTLFQESVNLVQAFQIKLHSLISPPTPPREASRSSSKRRRISP